MSDEYTTISGEGDGRHTEKMSRFLSFAFPVTTADGAKDAVASVTRRYHDARHICWAYMPPILVPTMTSGCFFLHSSFRNGSATAGSTGISGAMISKSCSRFFSVSMVLLAAEEPKP